MCLKELRDEFLYDCECRHLAKGSLRNYRASTRFLLEFLERKQITELEDVRPRHLRDLMKEKQDAGNTPRYINDLLKVWRTWFNYLVEEGYLEERDNPAKKVKPLRQPRTIIDTFTAAEMKRIIQFYDGKDFLEVRNKTIIMLLFDTGMRCNEMILMEPEDIKPDYILVKHGKGGKERVVPTGSGSEAGRAGRGKALPDRSRTQQIRGSLKPAPGHIPEKRTLFRWDRQRPVKDHEIQIPPIPWKWKMKKGCGTNIQKYDTRKNRSHAEKISAGNRGHA